MVSFCKNYWPALLGLLIAAAVTGVGAYKAYAEQQLLQDQSDARLAIAISKMLPPVDVTPEENIYDPGKDAAFLLAALRTEDADFDELFGLIHADQMTDSVRMLRDNRHDRRIKMIEAIQRLEDWRLR